MPGEIDLHRLLRALQPALHESAFVFRSLDERSLPATLTRAEAMIRESDGVTLVLPASVAEEVGISTADRWAKITLNAPSDLHAIGFLAVVCGTLARARVSVNPFAGFHHDHLFVPWEERNRALEALLQLMHQAEGGGDFSSGSGSAPGAGTPLPLRT